MGEILRLDLNSDIESEVTLVIGSQEIRRAKVHLIYTYRADNDYGGSINALVQSIHFGREHLADSFANMVYYRNCYGHKLACLNDSIINLISDSRIRMYVTICGAILLYDECDFYSTVDMQQLNFHPELNDAFAENKIIGIYADDNEDFIILENKYSSERITLKLMSTIDLASDCSVRITFEAV